MEAKRQTEIMIEKHEVTVIRLRRVHSPISFCEICRTTLRHFSISRAATLLQISEMAVFRLIEDKQIHADEGAAVSLRICSRSLTDWVNKTHDEND